MTLPERLKSTGVPVNSDPVRERLQATDAASNARDPQGWRSPDSLQPGLHVRETVKGTETRRSETGMSQPSQRHLETLGRPISGLEGVR